MNQHDPRPRYLAAGSLFLVGALVTLIAGVPLLTLLLALVAAAFFYWMTKVQSVP
jgi:maltodextrin utilization protein YvdJ